jgi:hypothetical protein
MRVSSVQLNSNSPSFNGVVSVRNLKSRKTQVYRTSPDLDRKLGDIYTKIHKSANVDDGILNIKRYVSKLYESTKDEFLNKLPAIVKEDSLEVELSAKSTYATYQGGATYSELKTNGFEIIHDMAK